MAVLASLTEESFIAAVNRALRQEVERVAAEEAELAADRVRERVRSEVARIAMSILTEGYQIHMTGRDVLEIRVDLTKRGQS